MKTINEIREAICAAHTGDDTVCIRFCEINLDVWLDAVELAAVGGPYEWVADNCDLEPEELDLVTNHDYEVVDHDGGLVGQFYRSCGYWGSMDWLGLDEAATLISEGGLSEEIYMAAIECSIPLDKVEDAFVGHYSSEVDFAQDLWEDCGYLDDLPAYAQSYINWESVARDLMMEHVEHDGYFFRTDW